METKRSSEEGNREEETEMGGKREEKLKRERYIKRVSLQAQFWGQANDLNNEPLWSVAQRKRQHKL